MSIKLKLLLCFALLLNPALSGCATKNPSPLPTGEGGELDTSGIYTFAADGSFRMTGAGKTQMGRYTIVEPNVIILTFPAAVPGSSPQQIKFYYLVLKSGQRLLTRDSVLFDSLRKRQQQQ